MESNWKPIEGLPKQRRSKLNTKFSKKIADHRNVILKDWAERLESEIIPKIPIDYNSPFDTDKCVYCLSSNIGKTGDEFRPSSQRGRYNKVNCLPCCGSCNSSKQDKCGIALLKWIKEENPKKRKQINFEQQKKIIKWWEENEKYLIIPLDTYDSKVNKTYGDRLNELDPTLNKMYEMFL